MDAGSVIVAASEKGLSKRTMTDWTAQLIRQKLQPTMENFLKFIKKKAEEMDEDDHPSRPPVTKQQTTPQGKPYRFPVFHTREMVGCKLCGDNHALFQCPDFRNQTVDQRQAITQRLNACGGLTTPQETVSLKGPVVPVEGDTTSRGIISTIEFVSSATIDYSSTIRIIYSSSPIERSNDAVARIATNNLSTTTTEATCNTTAGSLASILGTCLATLEHQGKLHKTRGLVDNGSSVSFISARLATGLSTLGTI